jgi:hypothetical protein
MRVDIQQRSRSFGGGRSLPGCAAANFARARQLQIHTYLE